MFIFDSTSVHTRASGAQLYYVLKTNYSTLYSPILDPVEKIHQPSFGTGRNS